MQILEKDRPVAAPFRIFGKRAVRQDDAKLRHRFERLNGQRLLSVAGRR